VIISGLIKISQRELSVSQRIKCLVSWKETRGGFILVCMET